MPTCPHAIVLHAQMSGNRIGKRTVKLLGCRDLGKSWRQVDFHWFMAIYIFLDKMPNQPQTSRSQPPVIDKLWKIRKFMELIRQNCIRKYNVGQDLAYDESMIPFKVRICFRQFIPSRRTNFGIKAGPCQNQTLHILQISQYMLGASRPRQTRVAPTACQQQWYCAWWNQHMLTVAINS